MSIEEFIDKWNVAFESKEQQIEFAGEMRSDIEQIINDRHDGWISVEDIKEEGDYLCLFKTITNDLRQCVVRLQYVPRHCFENPTMDKRLFVYPSGGHEIRTAIALMPLPSPPKQ